VFWLRQLGLFLVIYFLLVYAHNSFFLFRIDQSFVIFQILTLICITVFSVFVFGRTTLKALYDISFLNLKTISVDKKFIVECAKLFYTKGALSLESKLKQSNDPFVHKSIHLLVDQVSINQFERELGLEIEYLTRKLIKAKSLVLFLLINYVAINLIYIFSLLILSERLFMSKLVECSVFMSFIIIGLFLPFFYLIDQYQNRKTMVYQIYKLGFVSIINQMSSRQIEIAISIEVDI